MKKKYILTVLLLQVMFSLIAGEWGILEDKKMPKAHKSGPVHSSKTYIIEAGSANGTASMPLMLDASDNAVAVVFGEQDLEVVVDKKKLKKNTFKEDLLQTIDLPVNGERFELNSLKPGNHSLKIEKIKSAKKVQMIVSQPESTLEMNVQVTPLATQSGEPVLLEVTLADEKELAGVTVRAKIGKGKKITLYDNGKNGDKTAGDGIYSVLIIAPAVEKTDGIDIRFRSQGKRFDGQPFQRDATASVIVTNGNAAIEDEVEIEAHQIAVPLEGDAGKYRVVAIYGEGENAVAWAREDIVLNGGTETVVLVRPTQALGCDRVLIKVLNLDTVGLEDELELAITPINTFQQLKVEKTKTKEVLPESKQKAKEEQEAIENEHVH